MTTLTDERLAELEDHWSPAVCPASVSLMRKLSDTRAALRRLRVLERAIGWLMNDGYTNTHRIMLAAIAAAERELKEDG